MDKDEKHQHVPLLPWSFTFEAGLIFIVVSSCEKEFWTNKNNNAMTIAFKYFKRIGICFYSIEDDLINSNIEALKPLSKDKVELNKQVLLREYGKVNMGVRINKIISVLNN